MTLSRARAQEFAPLLASVSLGASLGLLSCGRTASALPLLAFSLIVILAVMWQAPAPAVAGGGFHQEVAEQKAVADEKEPTKAQEADPLSHPFHMDFLQTRASHATGLNTAPEGHPAPAPERKALDDGWQAWEARLGQPEPQAWIGMFDAGLSDPSEQDPFAGFTRRV